MPEPRDVIAVQRLLRGSQGPFVPKPSLPIVDELIATVLSQHTSDRNSERAFAGLKAAFPAWEQVLDAPAEALADVIRSGGIADQKARRIQRILAAIREREGRIDLGRLRELDDAAVEEYLTSLPGVARRRPPACSYSPWAGPPSPSTPTSTASRSGSAGFRRGRPRRRPTRC